MADEQEPQEQEPTERQKIIRNLNKANRDIINRLTQVGFEIDPVGRRNELFMEKLVEWGIVTSEQMEEFNLAWVDEFNSYLIKLEADYLARVKQAQEEERAAQAKAKLGVGPGGIIVPGHHGRQNGTGRRRGR